MLLSQHGRSLSVCAPAKLNLFLEILGRRTDGYHELETLMVSIGIYDTLLFTEGESGKTRLRCCHVGSQDRNDSDQAAALPAADENLVVKAANLLRSHARIDYGVTIDLVKRIPVASGMAGGSSDAAATLAGLNRFWDLHLSSDELIHLAGRLGSDVAFFLAGEPAAVCRGRGEIVEPVAMPVKLWFVIVRPRSGLSTPAVFRECQPPDSPRRVDELLTRLNTGRFDRIGALLHNSLQEAAERLNSDVTELKRELSTQPVLGHLMTGSGTAYFGVCHSRRHAMRVAARLKQAQLGRVYVAGSGQ